MLRLEETTLEPKTRTEKEMRDFSLRGPTAQQEVGRKEKASAHSVRNDGGSVGIGREK